MSVPAEAIAKRFAKPRREGRTWRFACPLCGKPKGWARDHDGKTYVGCYACGGDWKAIRAAAGIDPRERSAPANGRGIRADIGREPPSDLDLARRLKPWRQSGPIKDSPAETYLKRRGLDLPAYANRSLRYCPMLFHWRRR
jgi:hypothetical protein